MAFASSTITQSQAVMFRPSHSLSATGIPVSRPITSYDAKPTTSSTYSSNYPSTSFYCSREVPEDRKVDFNAFRYVEIGGGVQYRAHRAPPQGGYPSRTMSLPKIERVKPVQSKAVALQYRTSSSNYGREQPEVRNTDSVKYHPRDGSFTQGFHGTYRFMGLSTSKDESPVMPVEFFSYP